MPRRLQISLSQKIQKLADDTGKEISSTQIWDIFENNYLKAKNNYSYIKHESSTKDDIHSLSLIMKMGSSKEGNFRIWKWSHRFFYKWFI